MSIKKNTVDNFKIPSSITGKILPVIVMNGNKDFQPDVAPSGLSLTMLFEVLNNCKPLDHKKEEIF